MSPADKLGIVSSRSIMTFELALAGVRQRHPDASDREVFLRLAIINLGRDLATRAYPEITTRGL